MTKLADVYISGAYIEYDLKYFIFLIVPGKRTFEGNSWPGAEAEATRRSRNTWKSKGRNSE